MVPFSAFSSAHWQYGSPRLERYNGLPSVEILGQAIPGVSTGEAMAEMEKMAAQLPPGIGYEWTGLSYEERNAGAQAPALYAISLLVVFLAVAALYESWTIPFVNLLMLPLGLVGAVTMVTLRGLPNDVYLQIGLLTTVGLSTKNAILIIQFIKEQMRQGHEVDGGDAERGKNQAPAGYYDIPCLLFRHTASCAYQGGWRRGSKCNRHRCDRRIALCHLHRLDLHSIFLRAGIALV